MSGPEPVDTNTHTQDATRALSGAMRAVLDHQSFTDAAQTIFELGKNLIGATAGYVALLSDNGTENEVVFLDAGGKECTVDPTLPMPIRGLREQAYISGRPVYENDFSDSAFMEFMPEGHARLDNVLFAPLVIDGRVLGLIGLANKPGGFTDDDVEHAVAFGDMAAIALHSTQNLERLRAIEARLQSKLAINTRKLAEVNRVMAAVLEHTHVMAVLLDKEFNFIWVNRSYADVCGHSPEFFLGKNHFDLYPNQENESVFRRVCETCEPFFVEAKAFEIPEKPELGVTYWDWSLVPVLDSEGEVTSLVFTLINTTENTRARMADALIERLHRDGAGHSLNKMLTETLDGICELMESPIGFYHFVEPDERTLSLQAWSTSTLAQYCEAEVSSLHYDVDKAGVWADCLRERRPVIHNDYAAMDNKRGMPEGHAELIRVLVVPIFRHQRIVGILGVGNRSRDYTDADAVLISHVADVAWEIAQSIRADEELSKSEERYRRSLELFPEGVLMFRDGHITYANAACVNLLGAQSEKDLLGSPVMERVDPAYLGQARDRVGRLLQEGGVAPLRSAVFLRLDGSQVDVEVTAAAFDTSEGRTVEVVLRDRSDSKRAEEALLKRNALLAQAQSIARFGWYDLDIQSGFWESSDVLDEILGIDESFVRDVEGWVSIVHPDDRVMMTDYFQREVIGTGQPFDKKYRVTRISDGNERWVHGAGRLETDEAGAIVRMIGTIQDITQRHLAEQKVLESAERYRTLIEHSPLAILVNRADRVELANTACAELFLAESPDELLGMSVLDLFHPDERGLIKDRIHQLRSFGAPLPVASERIARMNGEYRHVEVSAAPFVQGDETLIHVVLRDTTDERAARQELQRHQEKLSELASELIRTSERERHRLAVELHDSIGQELAAAKISAKSIANETPGRAVSKEHGRLLDLLDYSILHVRALTAQLSPPALYELGLVPALERLVEDFGPLYGMDCVLSIEQEPDGLTENTSAVLFRAARELLSNVHRHASVDVARLTLQERHGSAILRVEDKGQGFDTSAIDSGSCTDCFGLFSLREEARNLGGQVIVRSEPDSGTFVEVCVPLEPKT